MSCDKQVSELEKHSLATRVPRIVLQRAEETFPAVRESIMGVFVFRQEFYCHLSFMLATDTKRFVTLFSLFA
jgi:hypothetical protein